MNSTDTIDSAGEHALSLADLPYLLDSNTALPSIDIPVSQKALDEMRARLAEAGPAPYIAITYRAARAGKDTLVKNAPLKEISEALKDNKATLINVQRLPTQEEKALLTTSFGTSIADFSDVNDNLEEALALMSLLDDYIGVSNTNMHLRAAAGKSARVLVTYPGEYRWLVDGDRSPWFPNFDLYRQDSGGSWERAFRKLSADIKTSHE